MMWEPVSERAVREMIARAMNAQDQAAREAVTQRRALYGGEMLALLRTRIAGVFADAEERKALQAMASVSLNLTRFIVDSLAVVYRYGAARTWRLAKPVEDAGRLVTEARGATAAYNRILDQCEANLALDYVDKMCLLCGDALLRYEYNKWGHRLYPMTRDMCDVLQDGDDPRRVTGVIWSVALTDTPIWHGNIAGLVKRRWFHADALRYCEYDPSGRLVREWANPYAALNASDAVMQTNIFYPFLDFHDGYRPYTFWREHEDEALIELALEACLWLTYLNGQLKYNTLKQVFEVPGQLTPSGTRSAEQFMSWTSVYRGPAGGNVGILDYTVALDMTIGALRSKLELYCATNGLPTGLFAVEQTQSASGVRVKLDRVALAEMRGQRIKQYIARERALARLIQYASNYHFEEYPAEDVIDNTLDARALTIDFGEPPQVQDPKDDREQWSWEFDHGISTPADFLRMKCPDMTLDGARAAMAANLAEKHARDAEAVDARMYGMAPARVPEASEDE